MTEKAPQILTQQNVFKSILRKMTPYTRITQNWNPDLARNVGATATAFHLLHQQIEAGGKLPTEWDGFGFDISTVFTFLKEKDGAYVKVDKRFETPIDFINDLKRFHGLADLVSEEEKREIEDAKAAEQAKEAAKLAEIQSGRWVQDRMPDAQNSETPVRPDRPMSPFRPKS